jgi:hypothetical protein
MTNSTYRRRAHIILTVLVLFGQVAVVPGHGQPAPGFLQISVTGGPAPVGTLRMGILTAVRALVPETRSEDVTLVGTAPPLADLQAGSTATVQAVIQITPPEGPPSGRVIPVTFRNIIFPWSDAQVLLVSNSPETLPFGKVLFSGALNSGQTIRLLYHHQNGSRSKHMQISVALSNPTRSPVVLWVSGAQSGDGGDELALGHAAARQFLEQYWNHAGFLVQVPANATLPFLVHDLAPLAVGSGLAQIQLVQGTRLNLQVVARLDGEADPPPASFAPDFDKLHQRGAFKRPQVVRTLTYTAGGPPVAMEIGADTDLLDEEATGERLQGNYGVMYVFDVQAQNPTPDPVPVALVMRATGGPARATLLVGDRLIDGPVVQPNAPQVLTTLMLAPGIRRILRIATMPESGSNYPVRLTLEHL